MSNLKQVILALIQSHAKDLVKKRKVDAAACEGLTDKILLAVELQQPSELPQAVLQSLPADEPDEENATPVCKSCGEEFCEGGDGYDGRCASCADRFENLRTWWDESTTEQREARENIKTLVSAAELASWFDELSESTQEAIFDRIEGRA
jgi:hypothetical protein